MFRHSGLPSGAQLELVQSSRSPSVVTVALQLPQSGNNPPSRLTHKFPSSTSIWQILRQFESGAGSQSNGVLIITQRGIPIAEKGSEGSGRLYYEMPAINILNRELASFVDLQKTLAQLGVTGGNVLLRLNFKNSGLPMEEAITQISQYFKSSDSEMEKVAASGSQTPGDAVLAAEPSSSSAVQADEIMSQESPAPLEPESLLSDSTVPSTTDTPMPDTTTDTPIQPSLPAPTVSSEPSGTPEVKVYTAPTHTTPLAATQPFNTNDYEPTLDHARTHQARLATSTRNRRLPSDIELAAAEKERKDKLALVTSVRVRIRLPDQTMLETPFGRESTGADVYKLVRGTLAHAEAPFALRYVDSTGAHVTLPDGSAGLITKVGWRGNVLVSMVWDATASAEARKAPSLKQNVLSTAQQLTVTLPDEKTVTQDGAAEKQGGFLDALRGGKDSLKEKLSGSEKEAKLSKFLRFGKK